MICLSSPLQNEGKDINMIRTILKLLILPIWLILCLLSGLMDVVLRLYSLSAGIFYLFLIICFILALVSKQLTNLGILSGFLIGALLLTLLIGVVGAIIEVWKDRIKTFLIK